MNSSEKTAQLLKMLGRPPYVHGVTELSARLECGKSGTFKLLAALVESGLAAQTADHKYSLGPAVFVLGETFKERIGLETSVTPFLERLRDETGENASFSMLVNGKAVLLARAESPRMVRVAGNVGEERPIYAGANGKVLGAWLPQKRLASVMKSLTFEAFTEKTITNADDLLAEFKKIREDGYALSDGELNIETVGIGAPIKDENGTVRAALSLAAPRMRLDEKKTDEYVVLVKETADEISRALFTT